MTHEDKKDVIAVCNILADKMSDSGQVAVQQIIGAVKDMVENESCEDAISRKDVIILIDEATELHSYKVIGDSETYSDYNQGWEDACNWLYANVESDNLKTVTPKQKATGSWVEKQVVDNEEVEIEEWQSARCSNCDKYHTTPYSYCFNDYNYCPNCGAKMEESEDKE